MMSTDQNTENSVYINNNMDSIAEPESNKDQQLKNAMSIAGMYVAMKQNQDRRQQAEQTKQNIIDILLILLTSNPFFCHTHEQFQIRTAVVEQPICIL
jgi:hypothetical protein